MKRAVLAVLAILAAAAPVKSQDTLRVKQGDRVRITPVDDSGPRISGRLLTLTPDSLYVATSARPSGIWLDTAQIRQLEVNVPRERGNKALVGTLVGAALGLGYAYAVGGIEAGCPLSGCDGGDVSGLFVAESIVAGAALGGLAATLLPSGRWQVVWIRP